MTQNEHVYAICCQLEVDDDVTSGQNINTVQGYVVVKILKVLALILSEIFQKDHDSEVGDGSGRVNAIYSRPEVVDDVISSKDV